MQLGDLISGAAQGENGISLGTIVDAAGRDAVGLLLSLPALIILLPVSVVPGVSPLCALLVLFSALHEVAGLRALWLPERVRAIRFDQSRLTRPLASLTAWMGRIDRLTRPRLPFFLTGRARLLAATAITVLAAGTIVLSFVPLADMALTLPMLCFGLAIRTGDGLFAAGGWGLLVSLCGAFAYWI
jgi:hypothetical protein